MFRGCVGFVPRFLSTAAIVAIIATALRLIPYNLLKRLAQAQILLEAAEFQKFPDHRGIVVNYPLASLARLGLARAYALSGDTTKSKTAYQDFLTLWRDADPECVQLSAQMSKGPAHLWLARNVIEVAFAIGSRTRQMMERQSSLSPLLTVRLSGPRQPS